MKPLFLFDCHCDTPYRMFTEGKTLKSKDLAVSWEQMHKFQRYRQVMAFWIPPTLSPEDGWNFFRAMRKRFLSDAIITSGKLHFLQTGIKSTIRRGFYCSLEDGRILNGKLQRLESLKLMGIDFLIPFWAGLNCLGGAHDTDVGLTDFGRKAIRYAFELGIIPDISHASISSAREILSIGEKMGKPVIASHSNLFSVCPVSRNLTDEILHRLLDLGGIVGLNFHAPFIKKDGNARLADILPHIDGFLQTGAEKQLCLGSDLDGSHPPKKLNSLKKVPNFAHVLQKHGYGNSFLSDLFFGNACRFFDTVNVK